MVGTTAQKDPFAGRVTAPATASRCSRCRSAPPLPATACSSPAFPSPRCPGSSRWRRWSHSSRPPAPAFCSHAYGPTRTVPATFALNGALFLAEAWLLGPQPKAAAIVLYFTPLCWGRLRPRPSGRCSANASIPTRRRGCSRAWRPRQPSVPSWAGSVPDVSLPSGHPGSCWSCSPLAPRRAPAGAGGGARRRPRGGRPTSDRSRRERDRRPAPSTCAGSQPVATLAALAGTLCDYVLKADVVVHVSGSASLVGFFGLFYAATGIAAFAIQVAFAPAVLPPQDRGRARPPSAGRRHRRRRLPCGALSVAWHPAKGRRCHASALAVPHRLRTALHSAARHQEASVKTTIDVFWDCEGSFAGALVVLLLTRVVPVQDVAAITVACMVAAGVELVCAWRLRSGYVTTIEDTSGGERPRCG